VGGEGCSTIVGVIIRSRGGGVEPEGVEGEGHQANLRERGCHQSVKILNILAEEEGEKGKLEEKKVRGKANRVKL